MCMYVCAALADMGELPDIVPHLIPEPCPPTFPVRQILPSAASSFSSSCFTASFPALSLTLCLYI